MTSTTPLADQTVRDFLGEFRGARVYRPPLVDDRGVLVGNHGDRLIAMGTDRVLDETGIQTCDTPDKADLLLIDGSGAMLERSQWVPSILKTCCRDHSHIPLCVLPSTFHFPTRPIAELLGDRSAPVTLFCRERFSLDHLSRDHELPDSCRLLLDHDMAFELHSTDWLKRLAAESPDHTLIVERTDIEHPDVAFQPDRVRGASLRRWLPGWLKQWLRPLVHRARDHRRSPFRRRCKQLIDQEFPFAASLPRHYADVSNPGRNTFDMFTNEVAHAAVVLTTRMHVGILAALLGRPTCLFTGPYHKIRGVYEYSLAEMDHVRLLES